jgi:3-oxoacyl-[acyl-carrier-protein] synthase-3
MMQGTSALQISAHAPMAIGAASAMPTLRGATYVLGETEREVAAVEDFDRKASRFQMALDPKLWGWGRFRQTAKSIEQLAIETGLRTLHATETEGADVDAVILCSTRIPGGPEDHGQFIQTIFAGLGVKNAYFAGVTLNRCANMLVALQIAQALVVGECYQTILVITADRAPDEAARMERFAIFSDGAASCLVTAKGGGGYELLGSATTHDTAAAGWENEISAVLARQANAILLDRRNMTAGDVGRVMHANLYKPVVVMKERQAGFALGQLFLDNIERFGHCFAADPIINLADTEAQAAITPGKHVLLASSVPGSRAAVLLRKV